MHNKELCAPQTWGSYFLSLCKGSAVGCFLWRLREDKKALTSLFISNGASPCMTCRGNNLSERERERSHKIFLLRLCDAVKVKPDQNQWYCGQLQGRFGISDEWRPLWGSARRQALLTHKVLLKIKLVCACKSALRTIRCYANVRGKSLRAQSFSCPGYLLSNFAFICKLEKLYTR